jgi:CRP-like cAMP-binding protein
MTDMLELSAHLPEVQFAPGEVVIQEGTTTGSIWVLVSGSLEVRKGAVQVNSVVHPGALLGEVAVLLGGGHSASVVAAEPSVLR